MFGDSGEGDGGITRQFAAAAGDGDRIDALLELNSDHEGGVQGAETRLRAMLQRSEFLHVAKDLRIIGDLYVPCQLNLREAVQLVALDRATEMEGQKVAPEELSRERAIRRIWPDQEVRALSHLSGLATRIGAARRAYTAFMRPNAVPAPSTAIAGADDQSFGKGIVWAIVDSGVDERHMHFWRHGNLVGAVASLHKDFSGSAGGALGDEYGHGTHVAGIVAGAGPPPPFPNRFVGERIRQGTVDLNANQLGDEPLIVTRRMAPTELPFGVAPATQLVSIKVLDDS